MPHSSPNDILYSEGFLNEDDESDSSYKAFISDHTVFVSVIVLFVLINVISLA